MSAFSAAARRAAVFAAAVAAAAALAACDTEPTSAPRPLGPGAASASKVPANKATIASIDVAPDTVVGGSNLVGIFVYLTAPAPSGGALISLSSSDTSRIPNQTVTVPPGATWTSPGLTTRSAWTAKTVTVTASYDRSTSSTSVTLLPVDFVDMQLLPDTIAVRGFTQVRLTLNAPAPVGGADFTFFYDPTIVGGITHLVIPEGGRDLTFPMQGLTAGTTAFTASLNHYGTLDTGRRDISKPLTVR